MPNNNNMQSPAQQYRFPPSSPDAYLLKVKRFKENLAYISLWKQYEVLELLKQQADIWEVSIIWLQQFREDLDLKV